MVVCVKVLAVCDGGDDVVFCVDYVTYNCCCAYCYCCCCCCCWSCGDYGCFNWYQGAADFCLSVRVMLLCLIVSYCVVVMVGMMVDLIVGCVV